MPPTTRDHSGGLGWFSGPPLVQAVPQWALVPQTQLPAGPPAPPRGPCGATCSGMGVLNPGGKVWNAFPGGPQKSLGASHQGPLWCPRESPCVSQLTLSGFPGLHPQTGPRGLFLRDLPAVVLVSGSALGKLKPR